MCKGAQNFKSCFFTVRTIVFRSSHLMFEQSSTLDATSNDT
jgi:hypothetical protein